MKTRIPVTALAALALSSLTAFAADPVEQLTARARTIPTEAAAAIPVQNNGRIKPLQTLAREAILFITGRYSWKSNEALPLYLALTLDEAAPQAPLVEVRDPDLRVELGFTKTVRHYSVQQLQTTRLELMARDLFAKEKQNSRSLTPHDKSIIETARQLDLLRGVISGDHLLTGLDFTFGSQDAGVRDATGRIHAAISGAMKAMAAGDAAKFSSLASDTAILARGVTLPPVLEPFRRTIGLELLFTQVQPFLFAALLYLAIGLVLIVPSLRKRVQPRHIPWLAVAPVVLHILGFAARVTITGFAPVTSMYGTMIWVGLGVALMAVLLHQLYRQALVAGLLLCGSSTLLLLTHQIPLILSPDMDPIVAVLRSNLWLTIHVLTITLSYACFTVAMLLGNAALIRRALGTDDADFIKKFAHSTYRSIQLGVFLLSVGIILGGVWADYSWGRFWGWDPKETWALIADLGFLMILHGRYVGWVRDFGILAWSPVAYLLVIMAWYGVNFILAAGLHSYGFSSGGATAVAIFVGLQLVILALAGTRTRRLSA